MSSEARNKATIQPGKRLELVLPVFSDGEVVWVKTFSQEGRVDVVISRSNSNEPDAGRRKRQFGFARGAITMHDNFDDPIPDFQEYA